jgi:glycosyltransferase involved in cell wall biosynthesis
MRERICHLTTVHPRYDVRIFLKECIYLTHHYDVYLIVADGKGDEEINSVHIFDVGKPASRLKRVLCIANKVYRKAINLNCEIYHFHDPEFLFWGLKLARKGKKVIYDVHEDVPKQTLSKDYLNPLLRTLFASLIKITENYISARLYAIITATPFINERFLKINRRSININNYPVISGSTSIPFEEREGLCYIGSISRIRGIKEVVNSLQNIDVTLNLAGDFESDEFKKELMLDKNWGKVKYHGSVSPGEVIEILKKSQIGLVTFLPEPNHIESQPNKMFEYMAAGLPLIASDFPLWKEIVEGNKCGVCVNPKNPEDISTAINYLLMNQDIAMTMGWNGVKAVNDKFNWNSEKEKLLTLYSSIFQ